MTDAVYEKTYAIFDAPANRKIIENLRKAGANRFLFPMPETEKSESDTTAINGLENLAQFDWLVFMDVFAVDYFLEILESNSVDVFELDNMRVCAFGEAVSDRLRFASVHADVIPTKIEPSKIFSALLNYTGEIENLKFLILTDDLNENDLAKNLRVENAEVVELPVYRWIPNETSELIKLKTLLKGGAIDEFILTAPSDLLALNYYFKSENLADVLAEIKISVPNGVMLQAVMEYDLKSIGLFHSDNLVKVS